jgi:hypothetical protein
LQCAQPAAAQSALWCGRVNGWLEAGLNDRAQHRQVVAKTVETQSVTNEKSRANKTASMISCSQLPSAVDQRNWNSVREMNSYR